MTNMAERLKVFSGLLYMFILTNSFTASLLPLFLLLSSRNGYYFIINNRDGHARPMMAVSSKQKPGFRFMKLKNT